MFSSWPSFAKPSSHLVLPWSSGYFFAKTVTSHHSQNISKIWKSSWMEKRLVICHSGLAPSEGKFQAGSKAFKHKNV